MEYKYDPPMRICYSEEWDGDFIRWTMNLLSRFLQERSIELVKRDVMIASIWRSHDFPPNLPVKLEGI